MQGNIEGDYLVVKIPITKGELSQRGTSLVCHNDSRFQPIDGTDYSVKIIVTRKLEGNIAHLYAQPVPNQNLTI